MEKQKVAIIDDNSSIFAALNASPDASNIELYSFLNSEDFFAFIKDEFGGVADKFDTIICDKNLNGKDGLDTLSVLVDQKYLGKLILLTGEGNWLLGKLVKRKGIVYVQKDVGWIEEIFDNILEEY